MPWGQAQTKAFWAIVNTLTTRPVLAAPDWTLPFALHTDASELAADAVLTQEVEKRDAAIGLASNRFTRAEAKLPPNDREVLAVLYGLEQFRTYLQHRRFTLITDCAALTWLFTSQHLSPKMHRWAVRMMQFTMDLQWRKGLLHTAPDALSRLRRRGHSGEPETAIDTSFPDDTSLEVHRSQEPEGPVLEGVSLQSTANTGRRGDRRPAPAARRRGHLPGRRWRTGH